MLMFRFAVNPTFQTLLAGIAVAMLIWPASGAESTSIPNFSPDSHTGWIAGLPDGETPIGDDFLPPPSGPGPVTFDKAHPYIDNQLARRTGKQPSNRVADLTNPILLPWAGIAPRSVELWKRALP
jgi:hypothetical protein